MFSYLLEKNLISEIESGFNPADSCVNQPIAIINAITFSFDGKYEVTGTVFLDISRAYDKVCPEGIIHKLKSNAISGNLLSLLTDFIKNRKQRVF